MARTDWTPLIKSLSVVIVIGAVVWAIIELESRGIGYSWLTDVVGSLVGF